MADDAFRFDSPLRPCYYRAMNPRWLAPPLVFVGALGLYLRTLAPSVVALFDDSLEFQLVGYRLAIAHPTGYPLYTLLLKLSSFLPFGDVAYRANLLSAIFAALAVALVCLIVLDLTNSVVAAFVSAIALAISPVFWSQAVVAEVYALNALFVAAIVRGAYGRWQVASDHRSAVARHVSLAFWLGLSLTHHRTILLLVPAWLVYAWPVRPSLVSHIQYLIAFLAPLTLYLYIPLRGELGSLDGTYQNTLDGFVRWITASGYNIFLSDNPFHENRDAAFFFNMFLHQFGWLGLALSVIGFAAQWRDERRTATKDEQMPAPRSFVFRPSSGLFILVAFLSYLAFVLVYRVPDIEVFAIPAFMLLAIALGCGLHAIIRLLLRLSVPLRIAGFSLLTVALLTNFVFNFQPSFIQNDLSRQTDVRDYGRDILAQPFPPNATLVGILGEMTLVRYFQATEGLQPALVTMAADRDDERLAAIENAMSAGHVVFTTRPLNGLPEKYSLGAFGPLVRVWPAPRIAALPSDAPRVGAIKYRNDGVTQPYAGRARLQVAWQPTAPIHDDLKVSARLLDGEQLIAQKDDWPVHNAYHTPFWRAGEVIADVYDLKIPEAMPAKKVRVLLIVYRADSGAEVGRADLGEWEIAQTTS